MAEKYLANFKLRTPLVLAFLGLAVAWAVLLPAREAELWQLAIPAVLLAAVTIGYDVAKEGYFHPVFLFGAFTLAMALVGMVEMAFSMDGTVSFFQAYKLPVSSEEMFILASEQLLLLTALYTGYVIVNGLGENGFIRGRVRHSSLDSLWLVFYLVGLGALLYLIVSTGGFTELFDNLGAKYERAAGNGEIILLMHFAYAGILIWYKKNIRRSAWQRYGGIIILNLPLLLSGSRTGMLITLIAVGYMDEWIGRRIRLKILLLIGMALTVFLAAYGSFRGQMALDFFSEISKSLSMGIGYVVATQIDLIGDQFRPGTLLLAFSSMVPSVVEALVGFPDSPNYIFSQALIDGTPVTVSMGIMGEANFVLNYGWSFFYYLFIAIILSWVGSYGQEKSLLLTAVIAGSTIRIAKGGVTAGGANLLMIAIPILLAYLLAKLLTKSREKGYINKKQN